MIRLNRHHIFIAGVITAFLFVGIHILNFRLNSSFTEGKSVGGYGTYVVIAFKHNGKEIRFMTESKPDPEMRDHVKVIYSNDNPENAAVYTFLGFYMFYFYFTIIPLMLLAAFVYSWFDKHDFVTVNFRKMKVSKETAIEKVK